MAFRLWIGVLVGGCAGFGPTVSAEPMSDAIALYRQKRYSEAKAILEPLVAAKPSDAAACYFLGMALLRAGGPSALDSAHAQLAKAAQLAPKNAGYLAEYAGVCLLMADRDNSFGLALEGRDAMARAIAADPSDLEACEGLMRFHAKAPWPLGDPDKALELAGEIAKRDPKRGMAAYRSIEAIFSGNGRKRQALSASQAAQRLAQGRPE
jgi:tetratricopeptide (TPR) repeat protein